MMRMQEAKLARDVMQVESIKKNIFLLNRWEYLKDRKKEKEKEVLLRIAVKERATFWTKGTHFNRIITHFWKYFSSKKEEYLRK